MRLVDDLKIKDSMKIELFSVFSDMCLVVDMKIEPMYYITGFKSHFSPCNFGFVSL